MAHKDQNQKQKKIQFRTPRIIKIAIWGIIAVIATIAVIIIAWPESKPPAKKTAGVAMAMKEILYCAGDYDFTDLDVIKNPQKIIPIEKDCWTKVVLPTEVCFDGKPLVNMELMLTDGKFFIITPTKRPHLGQLGNRRILIVRGQKEVGVWTIDFEKS